MNVSENAQKLHSKMLEYAPSHLFDQEQLQEMVNITNPVEFMTLAQELVNSNLVKLMKQGDILKFQAKAVAEANKISAMSNDEVMVYSYIEASGREGIWTKTIRAKTNLHQHVVLKCLKSLESQRFIKSIKSVKNPTRKIYMLYNLQPSIEVTGGPWFTDNELDTEFIDSLLTVIWRYIASKTFPHAFQPPSSNVNVVQSSYPANHTGYITLDAAMEFITSNKITNIELGIGDIRSLCEVLVYDDKLELINGTVDTYKATWQSVLEAGYGRSYLEEGSKYADMKSVFENPSFSIFENNSVVVQEDDEGAEDIVYLDSWIHQ